MELVYEAPSKKIVEKKQKMEMVCERVPPAKIIEKVKIKGKVVLMKKNLLDFVNPVSNRDDLRDELLGQKVSLQLVSSITKNGSQGKLGEPAYLENWINSSAPLTIARKQEFEVTFDWDEEIGFPGAFVIKNHHHSEFHLITLTLEDVPRHGRVHFVCNSWVYPVQKYKKDRVFFSNRTYLPSQTPGPLLGYREEELEILRGNGTGKLEEWDRVYDYAYYNDLGNPDNGSSYVRPSLGGSKEYPYPRRGRTGRSLTHADPYTESRLPLLMSLKIYVPRDERFGHIKMMDFLAYALKALGQVLLPLFMDITPNEFDSMEEILKLYEGGVKLPGGSFLGQVVENVPVEMLKQLIKNDGEGFLKFSMPQVIKEDKSAWRTDEEFAREMVAGVNPVVISNLNLKVSARKLTRFVKGYLEGLSPDEALKKDRLFVLDHHDALMPYLGRINAHTPTKTYATRTVLFLQKDGTLKPLGIELSLPHPGGEQHGEVVRDIYPSKAGIEGTIWELAKAYAAVNDSGFHQLISHWLNTHAVIEPFVIATNRQLSVVHPIYKLLQPHFRDTMNINAFARTTLINAGGILESTVFPGKFAMEMSSAVYKDWVFTEQALPADLIKRGVAVEDEDSPCGLRLLIEDYPYAVDGLEIWSAIQTWVEDYVQFYYKKDSTIQKDSELQSWWKEVREEGHGDKKDEPWWPKMKTRKELIDTCTIIIWVASALHAAVNFGQYPYAGYLPNRPTMSRRFMPEPGTLEYDELKTNPEKAFLKTITAQIQTLLGVSLIEILSRHTADEVYLGQRDSPEWTADKEILSAFERFGKELAEIEKRIIDRNLNKKLKNRLGPVKVPYTLLYPTGKVGLSGFGIPNSVSI